MAEKEITPVPDGNGGASVTAQAPVSESEQTVTVPLKMLTDIQEGLARAEQAAADAEARAAGVETLVANQAGADPLGEAKIREKKTFEPKFRTVRIRKYPMAGDVTNPGYVIGWTSRGAYQEVDRSGVSPQIVDYIDIFFLGNDRTEDGKLKAEKVKLLDLLNKSEQVNCKIIKTVREDKIHPTGEEISVTSWDPQHGLIDTGEKVDGFYKQSDITYTIAVPGNGEIEIDAEFVN